MRHGQRATTSVENPDARAQEGAALLVAMVMIFMLTVLGTSAMRGATLEGQLATNVVHKDVTFQAAESATDVVLSRTADLQSSICSPDPIDVALPELSQDGKLTTEATLEYAGRTQPHGVSFGIASAHRFVITGQSTLADGITSTTISQGIQLIGAAGSGEC